MESQYQLLEELGRGGMGVVYLARQQSLGRLVAIKTLLPQRGSDPHALARLQREATILRDRVHLHVVRLIDVDLKCDPPFLVFEYLEGHCPPGRILLEGGIAKRSVIRILRGILHRDLKPANILVNPEHRPRIIDFGLALSVESDQTRLTGRGDLVGTLAYMAPEPLTGGDPDARPDLYSFGLIAYELVLGQPVFSPDATSPIPPARRTRESIRFPRDSTQSFPPSFLAAIESCLELDPARRPASARDLLDKLDRPLQSSGAACPDPGEAAPAAGTRAAWPRRRRAALAGAALSMLALAGFSIRSLRSPGTGGETPVTSGVSVAPSGPYQRPAHLEALARGSEEAGRALQEGRLEHVGELLEKLVPVLRLSPAPGEVEACQDYWNVVKVEDHRNSRRSVRGNP